MTEIGEALKSILSGTTGVTALLSTRIYPVTLPKNPTLPCIVYTTISDPRDHNVDLVVARVQFSIYGTTPASCLAVKRAIVGSNAAPCLNKFSGVVDGVRIKMVSYITSVEMFDQQSEVFMLPVDFQAVYLDP